MSTKDYRTTMIAPDRGHPAGSGNLANPERHLTEDQIDDQLMGDLGPPWSEHLADCELCVSRVADAAAPLLHFKAVTLAWGERRSATLPLHQTIAGSAKFHPRLAWVTAAAVALTVGVAIPVVSHQGRQESAQTHLTGTATEGGVSTRDQILRDNQMLQAIDRELDASVDSAEALGLQPVDSPAPRKSIHPSPVED